MNAVRRRVILWEFGLVAPIELALYLVYLFNQTAFLPVLLLAQIGIGWGNTIAWLLFVDSKGDAT